VVVVRAAHPGSDVKAVMAVVTAPLALVVLLGAGFSGQDDAGAVATTAGVNAEAIPPLAGQLLPYLQDALATNCPDLPALWVVAETAAESGWNPRAYSSAGAAGLLQMMPSTWVEAGGEGGAWTTSAGPAAGHPVWDPKTHLRVAIGWMCVNLRMVTDHLRRTGKPAEVLDALAVCHIAGCSRVTRSATGVPTSGEAGCGDSCVQQIRAYLAAIHRYARAYAAPALSLSGGTTGSPPEPFLGGTGGCTISDPTGTGGCVTPATAWLLAQVTAHIHQGPVSCWDRHAWNPASDHPQGQACDYTFGKLGTFPSERDIQKGWALAQWLRTYAAPLHVAYVIWQGRIWSRSRDAEGWRPYGGGGVYDPSEPTGGHYDHVHVSLTD
jgi:Transglycosylase SLT domain